MKKNISLITKKYREITQKYFSYFTCPSCKLADIVLLCAYLCMVLASGYFVYLYHAAQTREVYTQKSLGDYHFFVEKPWGEPKGEDYLESSLNFETLDYESDTSYQKYVDPQVPFQDLGYIPPDMRRLSLTHISDTRGDLRLRDTAATALEELAESFYAEIGEKVVVVSSYRSYERQRQIKAGGCPDHLCAKAGYSEHQSGLAIDFWSASTQAYWQSSPRLMRFYDWLYDHAHLYGYHNSYQNGVEIDGYAIEPWHWRYLGVELASYLREQEITFAEFYYGRDI